MKTEIKLLLVVLLLDIATSTLKNEKKVRSHKKSRHSSNSDEINYEDFLNPGHSRRLSRRRSDETAVVFNETFLNEFKKIEKQ